ncbi:MAG: hypothetical protein M0P22_02560 [Methanoculleus sp.]|nr:hypothetical protein [Methanoculleus sp.]
MPLTLSKARPDREDRGDREDERYAGADFRPANSIAIAAKGRAGRKSSTSG